MIAQTSDTDNLTTPDCGNAVFTADIGGTIIAAKSLCPKSKTFSKGRVGNGCNNIDQRLVSWNGACEPQASIFAQFAGNMSPLPSPAPDSKQNPADAHGPGMVRQSNGQAFRLGMIQSIPLALVIVPFGLLFGVVALEAGVNLVQTMSFSMFVLAGASQFTALQLLSEQAPAWLIIISALMVNLRMAMYSASLVPWLGQAENKHKFWIAYSLIDQNYTLSILHFERHPGISLRQRLAYFTGSSVLVCGGWISATLVGALAGRAIPEDIALDFAIPITFLAMIAPMLRTFAHMVAALVAIISSLVLSGLPPGVGLMVAAPLGMAAGALTESWIVHRRPEKP